MSASVVNLSGSEITPGKPNDHCVDVLERLLERAKAGEIQGVGVVSQHSDQSASYWLGGMVGGYSMLGSLQVLQAHLVSISNGE